MSMRYRVVALLAGAVCAWVGEAARPCATGSEAADDGGCAAAEGSSMIQARSAAGSRKGDESQTKSCKNLGVFLDGTWNELNDSCDFGSYKRLSGTCETQVAALWRLARDVSESEQLIHYEPGVATSRTTGEDGNFGLGTKQHALNVYNWLSRKYESCGNKIYVFAFSRGALSARMLQGMIHRVGLAKPGYVNLAAQKQFSGSDAEAAAFKSSSDKVFSNVKIQFMGNFDTILRTLLHPIYHRDIASFHMQMTSTVQEFVHAISLDEFRETYDAAELYVDPATNATQVWFLGEHNDVGGGWQNTGIAQIAGGWMADKAVDAGFLLPSGWRSRSSMTVNYLGDTFTERGLPISGKVEYGINVEMTLGLGLVRNPMRCRSHQNHPFRNQPVLVHQSVRDRMAGIPGWVPLPYCCGDKQAFQDNINYVTNDHYEARKASASGGATWFKLSFRWVRDVDPTPNWELEWGNPEYYVRATSWNRQVTLPSGGVGAYDGCCTVVSKWPRHSASQYNTGPWWNPNKRAKQRFDTFLVLPNESAVADMINVELHEDDIVGDDFVGRTLIRLSDSNIGQMKTYRLSKGGTIEIKVESIASDAAARSSLPGSGPAQCRWLRQQSGMDQATVCNPTLALWGAVGGLNLGSAQDCDGFIQDIKTGAF